MSVKLTKISKIWKLTYHKFYEKLGEC